LLVAPPASPIPKTNRQASVQLVVRVSHGERRRIAAREVRGRQKWLWWPRGTRSRP